MMVGPRPEPMPPELAEAAERIDWRGPPVTPDDLPTFEIAHHPDGRTEMLEADGPLLFAVGLLPA